MSSILQDLLSQKLCRDEKNEDVTVTEIPCSSAQANISAIVTENEQFPEDLLSSMGVNVWSASQETLESQALNELNEFSKQNTALEDGEIKEDEVENVDVSKSKEILMLEEYIRKQEVLKKQQIEKKIVKTAKTDEDVEKIDKQKRKNNDIKSISAKKQKTEEADLDQEEANCSSGSEYIPSEEDSDYGDGGKRCIIKPKKKSRINELCRNSEKVRDDGLLEDYQSRLDKYHEELGEEQESTSDIESFEVVNDVKIEGHLKVPSKYWNKLYGYQQKAVKWLWSLHQKSTGGLLGDEMGLGKTVQIIAFLYILDYSRIHSPFGNFIGIGPTIIVCPATVIQQWVRHFHEWAPAFRVAVLHQSGRYQGNKSVLIRDINKNHGILVTTYLGILKYKGNLVEHHWHYVILDEGHKIRNATAKITVAVKQIKTPNRIMLTGSPMQNNLQELWSLFDFTNPGMLGELNTFMEHFNNPIIQGGFANASPMQEATALSVATALRNMISPFLLRRTKAEVQDHLELPEKSEQVLFCSLSDFQRRLYKDYLMSEHVNSILGRGTKKWSSDNYLRANMLMAITRLRKICNHPDIFIYNEDEQPAEADVENPEDQYGYYKKSGKMIVVSALLKIWKKQKHRVLLFSQGRAMIGIFELFLREQNYKYLKMDGSTSISSRQVLIDKFNNDESYDVFLLTTKVGGLGVNLTGANRVIIYDPDWNPATDTQARERAWRIGQNKQVTIYRLLSAGTIEEKMYQRQIWKQLLSNKILLDPKTHRAFKSSDLFDLFSLQEPSQKTNPETTNIFHDSRVKIQQRLLEKKKKKSKIEKLQEVTSEEPVFSEDKIEKMRLLAQQLAKNLTKKPEVKKTPYQKELEEERLEKMKKKQELKKLSVQELLTLNREKANEKKDDSINRLDDHEASCSFSDVLKVAETKANLYHKLVEGKLDIKVLEQKIDKSKKKKEESGKKKKEKIVIDESGKIDGEKVEGLVKREKRKGKKSDTDDGSSKDDFILGKLFSSKGVSGALEHDSVISGSVRKNNLRISTEASEKAEKAMQALTKSRLNKWRW